MVKGKKVRMIYRDLRKGSSMGQQQRSLYIRTLNWEGRQRTYEDDPIHSPGEEDAAPIATKRINGATSEQGCQLPLLPQ
jgi:hypothetical protein